MDTKRIIKNIALTTAGLVVGVVVGNVRINHNLTKFKEKGKKKAESWIQLDFLNRSYCLDIKQIDLD